jgi:hypothetical protein
MQPLGQTDLSDLPLRNLEIERWGNGFLHPKTSRKFRLWATCLLCVPAALDFPPCLHVTTSCFTSTFFYSFYSTTCISPFPILNSFLYSCAPHLFTNLCSFPLDLWQVMLSDSHSGLSEVPNVLEYNAEKLVDWLQPFLRNLVPTTMSVISGSR